MLLIYLVIVLICRQLDKADLVRIATIPLCGKDGSYKFEITMVTGRLVGAGKTCIRILQCLYILQPCPSTSCK